MDEQTQEFLDLARALIKLADTELSSRALIAHLYAIAALRGTTPRLVLEEMQPYLPEDSVWITEYLGAIVEGINPDLDSLQ